MVVKSTAKKRNKYKDKDGLLIVGVTLPEVLNKQVTVLAKREYQWGLYSGMAVKVRGKNGKLAIVEITAETPIKALTMPDMPKHPYVGKFIEKTSKANNKYFTFKLDTADNNGSQDNGEPAVLPF